MKIFIIIIFTYVFFPIIGVSSSLGEDALIHIQSINRFGERIPNSKGHQKTQEYIKNVAKQNNMQSLELNFIATTPLGKKKMKNIWFTHNQLKKNPTIILAAHYDSKWIKGVKFLGANDGLSGVGLILALIPHIQKMNLKNISITFLFLDGEESFKDWTKDDSLYGSRKQASFWLKNGFLKKISSFILLDMVGGEDAQFCKEMNSDRILTENIFLIGAKLGFKDMFNLNCQISVEDDHIPFGEKGVTVIDVIPGVFPSYWHTKDDTIDKIDPKSLNKVGLTLLSFIKEKNRF